MAADEKSRAFKSLHAAISWQVFLMHTKHFASLVFVGLALCAPGFFSTTARAQDVQQAFATARGAVSPTLQTKVVSVYGLGTPQAIQKWYIIFYDPSVASHGRAVLVENGQITKNYEARGGTTYSSHLTFDPSRITSEQPALSAAQDYASRHNIAYNGVRALLKQISVSKPFRWRIELTDSGASRGYVMVNAVDDTVAAYIPPRSASGGSGGGTGSASQDAQDFGNDVQKTFLGIGGDLQQFFTGERTVDR
jgi:hypothetical protein